MPVVIVVVDVVVLLVVVVLLNPLLQAAPEASHKPAAPPKTIKIKEPAKHYTTVCDLNRP